MKRNTTASRLITMLCIVVIPNMIELNSIDTIGEQYQIKYLDSNNAVSYITVQLTDYQLAASKVDMNQYTSALLSNTLNNITSQLVDSQYDN